MMGLARMPKKAQGQALFLRLAEFETANSTRISTASKKEWGDHVQSSLRAAHADHWLKQLQARVAPTSAVPPPTSQRPQRVCAPPPAPPPYPPSAPFSLKNSLMKL
jgi:hypothetical protein